MSEYIIKTALGQVIRTSDGKVVAPCQSNQDPDFLEYIEWIKLKDVDGKLINEPVIDDTIPVTEKQIIKAVQSLLDSTAQSKNYDNMLSLSTYANSTNSTFKAEAEAGVAWRDACWLKCYEIQASGAEITHVDEVLSQLPAIVWPS